MNEDLITLVNNLAKRMVEIDSHISTSKYRKLQPGEQDECPTGDDFNLLWDAILDECHAVGVDMSGILQASEI